MPRSDRSGSNGVVIAGAVALVVLAAGAVAWAVRAAQSPSTVSPAASAAAISSSATAGVAGVATSTTATTATPSAASSAPVASGAASDPGPVADPARDQFVPVLMYHHVMPNPNNFIAISPELFDSQMKWLSANGYHPVTIEQFTEFVRTGKRLPAKPVLITFDDGRENQMTYAVPILKKYRFTATFFVVKKWVVSSSKSFMHEPELKQLADDGFDVQSHTGNHGFLRRVKLKSTRDWETYPQMRERLRQSTEGMRLWLQQVTGKPVAAVAYPGGVHDGWAEQVVKDAGYTTAFTTDGGLNYYGGQSAFLVRRYNPGARGFSWGSWLHIFNHKPRLSSRQ